MLANLENPVVARVLEKVSFHSNPKCNVKACSNYHTIALTSYVRKVMLKSFKVGFSSVWTDSFQMYRLDLEKAEEAEIKLPTFVRS